MKEVTLYNIPVNENLIWDYDWEKEECKTERFFKWYLARILSYGTAKDLKHIDFEIIKKELKNLNIPKRIARFWFNYFGTKEEYVYGNIDKIAERIH